jgi:hypothetical protein
MSTNAEQSIDTKVFDLRKQLAHLVPKFKTTTGKQDRENWYLNGANRRVWAYGAEDILLPRPILRGDFHKAGVAGFEERPASPICGSTRLLTRTTKMNCFSWNLPAGPMALGGSCPGARMAFMRTRVGSAHVSIDPQMAIDASSQFSTRELFDTVPTRSDEAVHRFLCNGCYAIKGRYGEATVVMSQIIRQRWLVDYALPTGTFVDIMADLIGATSAKSATRPVPTDVERRAVWAHPHFFRIHDAGDFFSEEYFYAWLEICRRLPRIHFWAPTRIWCDMKPTKENPVPMGQILMQAIRNKDIPPNLAIRPSGLFFDGPQPSIRGLAGGASSSNFTYRDTKDGIEVTINKAGQDAWGCPAYLPSSMGGGAPPARTPHPQKGEFVRNRTPDRQVMRKMLPPDAYSGVFYPAVVDNSGAYVIDPKTGVPMSVNAATDWVFDANWRLERKRNKGERTQDIPLQNVQLAQRFQPAGCCSIAKDPYGNEECRICWGVSGMRRDKDLKHLPIVYAEH